MKNAFLKNNFALPVSLIFFVVACFGVSHHEMWSDEVHSWLLARDSHSLSELYFNKRYEAHPVVWYLILYALTSVTHNVVVMQYLHVVIASAFVYAWLRWAPFRMWIKIVALFSYFFIYEFTLISRLYSTEILLLFLICNLYERKFQNPILFSILMVLAANTILFGWIIVCGICGLIVLELRGEIFSENFPSEKKQRLKIIAGGTILSGGLIFSLISMIPPPDCYFAKGWNTDMSGTHFESVIGKIWEGFVPFPQFISMSWDSNILDDGIMKLFFSLAILGLAIFTLRKNVRAAITFLLTCSAILLFFFLKHIGFARHHGQLFFAFIVFLWIAKNKKQAASENLFRGAELFLGAFFIIQIFGGIYFWVQDWQRPFSPSREVADFIRKLPYEYIPVVKNDYTEEPIGAYLDVLPYCPTRQCNCSFFLLTWNGTRVVDVPQTLSDCRNLAASKKKRVILVMEDDYTPPPDQTDIKKIYISETNCLSDPQMFVYEIDPK